MRSRTVTLVCGLVVLGVLLSGGTALAGGGGGSAGNSQYVDPLSAQPHSSHHKTKASSTSGSTSTSSSTSTTPSSSTLSQAAPSSVSSSASQASSKSSAGKTLPFTGLNLWAAIGLGLGLLAAGLGLRRALARAY